MRRIWRERWSSRVNANGRFRSSSTRGNVNERKWPANGVSWPIPGSPELAIIYPGIHRFRVPPRGPRREDRMAKLIGNFGFAWETKVAARFKFLLFARRILPDRSTNRRYRDTVILSLESFFTSPGADKSVVNGSGCRGDDLARRNDFYPDSFTPNQSQKLVRSSMLRMKGAS